MSRKAGPRGFTLIELAVALAVAALIAVLVLPRLGWVIGAGDFVEAREHVVSELRIARGRAIEQRRSAAVEPDRLASAGVTLTVAPADGIRFHPDGSSSGGRVVLASGRREATVLVDWLTGRVHVAE